MDNLDCFTSVTEEEENRIKELLSYNPKSGKFLWREGNAKLFKNKSSFSRWKTLFSGKEAMLTLVDGYYSGEICGKRFLAHRVGWFLYYNEWPCSYIDHINGDRIDNRISNLRVTDKGGNARNARLRSDNTSGQPGVTWCDRDKRWNASISNNGKRCHIGNFLSKDDAIKARKEAEVKHGYHKNHGRNVT
jgi:hypothetical protein